jgi:hypothetical protein
MSEDKKHVAFKDTGMPCIRGGKFGEVHVYSDKTLRYRTLSKKLLKSLPVGVLLNEIREWRNLSWWRRL